MSVQEQRAQPDVLWVAQRKREERGGFNECIGMFVTAQPPSEEHEGEHAAGV